MKDKPDWNSVFVIAWTLAVIVIGIAAIANVAINAPTPPALICTGEATETGSR